jgi:hypothetical protein
MTGRTIAAGAAVVTIAALLPHAASAGIFGAFQDAVTGPDAGFMANSLALGQDIFTTIFFAFVVVGLCKATLTNSFDDFWWNLASVLVKMIPPLVALKIAQDVLPTLKAVADFFIGRITGNYGAAVGPDALIGLGLQTSLSLIHAATEPLSTPGGVLGAIANPGNIPLALLNVLLCFFAAVVIYFAFVFVACAVVLAWFKLLTASSIGAASVGFFGSEATKDMAFRYTASVIAGLWEVVFLSVWPFMVSAVFTSFHFAADLAHPGTFMQGVITLSVFGLVVIVMTTRIERIAREMFSGSMTFGVSDVARTAKDTAASARSIAASVAKLVARG